MHGRGAGNQAAPENDLITNVSNEANNSLIENIISNEAQNNIEAPGNEDGELFAHYLENDIKRTGVIRPKKRGHEKRSILFNEAKNAGMDGNNDLIYNDSPDYESRKNMILGDNIISEGSKSSKKEEAVPKEIADEGLANYYLNDLNRLERKPGRKRENGTDLPLITEKEDKPQILSELIQEDPDSLLNNIVNDNDRAGAGKKEEDAKLSGKSGKGALVREFEKSHSYMLEKQSFTQQDIDYAFGLEKKERTSSIGINSEMFDSKKTASSTYKTLFLEKIFGGMKGRYRDYRNKPQAALPGGKMLAMGGWLDKEFLNCANPKKDEIKMILSGITKTSQGNPDRDNLAFEFLYMLREHWLQQLYDETDRESDEFRDLKQSFESIRKYGKFRRLLEELADEVIRDNRKFDAGRDSVSVDDDD